MKTNISQDNPYAKVRNAKFSGAKAYFVEKLKENRSSLHLDFGAHDGEFVMSLKKNNLILKGVGLDANSSVVRKSSSDMPVEVELKAISTNSKIPYDDATFSTASIIGVVEHVVDQESMLKELHRVLNPDGLILVAVPGKHFFSFLDMGNWKFIFPKLHEWYVRSTKGTAYFKIHYSENSDGLYGDVEKDKFWHQHFSNSELRNLIEKCGFSAIDEDGFGFFNRIITNLAYFSPKILIGLYNRFVEIDARLFESNEIWILAKKN
jgi:ubiquinone/menaquinone biosynthesis C-methylase UbiE